ncbi:MAG: ABC transporter ATP-binding protein [Desulfobacter sp.]|nr:MAG: ABC transporter ATP-binding protein [Desulfobacter sp.]
MKKWLFSILGRYWARITWIVCLQAATALMVSIQPRYFQQIVALAVDSRGRELAEKGLPIFLILMGLYAGVALLQALGGYAGCLFSASLLKQLQVDFFTTVSRLPLQFYQKESGGGFFTRFNNDIGLAQRFMADFFPSTVREVITVAAVTGILIYTCPALLTLSAVSIALGTALLILRLNKALAVFARRQRRGWQRINRAFDETVQGLEVLKIFATEKERHRRFRRLTEELRAVSMKAGTVSAVFSPGIDLAAKAGGLALIALAYHMISREKMDTENFLLFFFYATLLQAAISNLVNALANIQNELTGIRHLADFFSAGREKDEEKAAPFRLETPVSIEFRELSFSYPGGRALFSGMNLAIPERGITVLRGPSGCGKSTLVNLLLRFYPVPQGSLLLGGRDISMFSRAELRRSIGVMPQFHHIFNDTLKENLLVAKPDAADHELKAALEKAGLALFLGQQPAGLDQVMDPRGRGISGGEKQRICLARVLLKQPPVMVLDEPWSNLDDQAKAAVIAAVNRLKGSATIVVLSHGEAPGLDADQVMDLGQA